MANPQPEDGHIDIANEIAEALARINLSGYESRILWVLFRKTYGWHKREDRISITQFQKFTGLKRRRVWRALRALIRRNLVTKKGDKVTVTQLGDTLLPKLVTKPSPKLVPTKEKKKPMQKKGEPLSFPSSPKENPFAETLSKDGIQGIEHKDGSVELRKAKQGEPYFIPYGGEGCG